MTLILSVALLSLFHASDISFIACFLALVLFSSIICCLSVIWFRFLTFIALTYFFVPILSFFILMSELFTLILIQSGIQSPHYFIYFISDISFYIFYSRYVISDISFYISHFRYLNFHYPYHHCILCCSLSHLHSLFVVPCLVLLH